MKNVKARSSSLTRFVTRYASPMRTRVSIATVVVSLTVALSSASASSEPKLAGTCPGNPFFGIYALHDISLDRACRVGVPTRAAGVIRCVNEPHGQFPISRLEIQRYRGYALSEDSPWGIRFKRGNVSFILAVQCS
jgi:hypothetical protein